MDSLGRQECKVSNSTEIIILDKTADANICKQGYKKVDGPQETVLSESVNGFMFDTGLTGSTDNWGKKQLKILTNSTLSLSQCHTHIQ